MKQSHKIAVLLHNIRSVHNVGSIFRTAEALGLNKIYFSGFTPTPVDRFGRIRKDFAKVALGAEQTMSWEVVESEEKIINKLKKENYTVIALEQNRNSVDYKKVRINSRALFVLGNEVDGISKEILKLCDVIAEIPMSGEKESLNVSVAFGIALFRILNI